MFTSPVKVPVASESSSLGQPLWFPSVALILHQWYRKLCFQKIPVSTSYQKKSPSPSSHCVSFLSRMNAFSILIFPKAQSNSVAYGNEICLCVSSSSVSSPSWMELVGSSCSDSVPVSKSCSSRKKLPMPYSSSCALVSAGEMWGDPRTKSANLPDF